MKKNKSISFLMLSIIFAVYNIIVFVGPFLKVITFWGSYGFTVLAFIISGIVLHAAFKRMRNINDAFLRIPAVGISLQYISVQIIISLICMSLTIFQPWMVVAACVVWTGINWVRLLLSVIGKDEAERVEEKVLQKTRFIRELKIEIELLIPQSPNEELTRNMKALVEKVRYSDPMSSKEVVEAENRITAEMAELDEAVKVADFKVANNCAKEINDLIDVRNQKLRIKQ